MIYDQGRGARELASWGKEKSKENCYRCAKKAFNDRFEGLLKKKRRIMYIFFPRFLSKDATRVWCFVVGTS